MLYIFCLDQNGDWISQVRAEDLDANMSKISEDKHLGIWRGPNVYSYFDTRIVRSSVFHACPHCHCTTAINMSPDIIYGQCPSAERVTRCHESGKGCCRKGPLSSSGRRSNMLLADLGAEPYGKSLNFLQFSVLPTATWSCRFEVPLVPVPPMRKR